MYSSHWTSICAGQTLWHPPLRLLALVCKTPMCTTAQAYEMMQYTEIAVDRLRAMPAGSLTQALFYVRHRALKRWHTMLLPSRCSRADCCKVHGPRGILSHLSTQQTIEPALNILKRSRVFVAATARSQQDNHCIIFCLGLIVSCTGCRCDLHSPGGQNHVEEPTKPNKRQLRQFVHPALCLWN